jgi:hypothetical protein
MYTYFDSAEQHTYAFDICAKADQVDSTTCLDVDNNKMPAFACQVAYGRAENLVLGVNQTLTAYTAGQEGVPGFAGASGVRIRMTGGTQCHHNPNNLPDGNPYREMDVWLKCNPLATDTTPQAPPQTIEATYCEYDFVWESSHGCRLCTDDDYRMQMVDPVPTEGQDGCRADGNMTVRYEKKPGVQCAHGVHGGAEASSDLNEFCTNCPAGFKRVEIDGSDHIECQACPAGQTSTGRNAPHCSPCTGNTFTDEPGMNQCYDCGLGTQANSEHTQCEFSSGRNCEYHASGLTYDLSNMANLQHMYGPISEGNSWTAHTYFLNLCTTSHIEHACYDKNDNPLISYSCQIPQGSPSPPAKDLGDVIGFKEFTAQQKQKYPDGGIHVQLTRGDVCHHAGAQQRRSTDILVACDNTDGPGTPELPPTSEWNPAGSVEPNSACAYEFLWKSRYGCPLCSIDTGSGGTYRKIGDECDPTTGYKKVTYERVAKCIGHPVTGEQLDSYTGLATFVDTGKELCVPMCPAGTYQVQQVVTGGTRTTCAKCPKGKFGPGGGAACEYCAGNTYSYEEGFAECVECGAGTVANGARTECDNHDCRFNLGDYQFDLKALDKGVGEDDMWGPLRDNDPANGFSFYINMCTRAAAHELNCAGDSGDPIESFVCQRTTLTSQTLGHLVGKNLGDTMGVDYLDPQEGETGLTVKFTHGEKCHHQGQPNRVTTVDMICDDTVGAGAPEPYHGTAEAAYCTYRFTWKTIHACPVCNSEHYNQVVSECAQDTNGAWSQTTHFMKNATCNTASRVSYKPPEDNTGMCIQSAKGGEGSDGGDTPWYHKPSFFITIIVLTTTLFAVIVTFALVKYWKVRRLYETYAQLDKDRGIQDDFTLPESMELSARNDGGL